MKGYKIKGKKCGRKKNGEFQCVCGKCKPKSFEINQDRNNSSNDCGNGRDK